MSTSNTDSAASGTVIAVARALTLLQCFTLQDGYLSLAELSKRSALHKTTVLRLARTLAEYQYLVRRHDGAWRLGSAAGWLGARYQASLDLSTSIEPVLKKLAKIANESATFFVKEDHTRVCLYRAEGPLAGRHYFRIGQSLPLEIGSPGKTILAFSGEQGEAFEAIRKKGYYASSGERDPGVASISAPVYGVDWKLLGAISVSGPYARLNAEKMESLVEPILEHANQLSIALGGHRVVRLL